MYLILLLDQLAEELLLRGVGVRELANVFARIEQHLARLAKVNHGRLLGVHQRLKRKLVVVAHACGDEVGRGETKRNRNDRRTNEERSRVEKKKKGSNT
jgi:hypothetical protein